MRSAFLPLFAAFFLVVLPAPSVAAPSSAMPDALLDGNYWLDTMRSTVSFRLKPLQLPLFGGRFDSLSGTLDYNSAAVAQSSLEISADTDGVDTGFGFLDRKLAGPGALDAAAFPHATLHMTRLDIAGTHATVTGDLTLHNVTHDIVLVGTLDSLPSADTTTAAIHLSVSGSVSRSMFGMDGLSFIADKVPVTVDAQFDYVPPDH
jgi:polyisoprenoid-binding protein YceI